MKRVARGVAQGALFALLSAAGAEGAPWLAAQRDVTLECEVRSWAVGENGLALADALTDSDWTRRAAALEGIRRALRVGSDLASEQAASRAVRDALSDGHPEVRVRALECLRELPGVPELETETARRLAREPLPAVRLALARSLERVRCDTAPSLLLELGFDEDARVAAAARDALLLQAPGEEARGKKLALLKRLWRNGDHESARHWRSLDRSEPSDSLLMELRALVEELWPGDAGHAALVEALAFGRLGSGDVERLLSGWSAATRLPAGLELLSGCVRGAGEDLSLQLLRGWARLDAEAEANSADEVPWSAWTPAQAALGRIGPERVLAWVQAEQLGAAALTRLLPALAQRLSAFPEESLVWVADDAPDTLRSAALRAFESVFSRHADPVAGRALLGTLGALGGADASQAVRAFRSLSRAEDPAPWVAGLHRAWRALPRDGRLELSRWLPRSHALWPFREDLIELGEDAREQRPALLELLSPMAGDPRVIRVVERWTDEALVDFAACASERGERPARNTVEGVRLLAALRALDALQPGRALERLEGALRLAIGTDERLARTCANQLSGSLGGRSLLERLLLEEGGSMTGETRVEACLALLVPLGAQDPGAGPKAHVLEVLIHALSEDPNDRANPDQRQRILRGLGMLKDATSMGFLEEFVDSDAPWEERSVALQSLGERGARAALLRAMGLANVELQRVAIRELARLDEEPARSALRALFWLCEGELPDSDGTGDGAGSGMQLADFPVHTGEDRGLLRDELLAALGRAGAASDSILERWLTGPLERARGDLEGRWRAGFTRASPSAATSFTYRGELELTFGLAREGRLTRALLGTPHWRSIDAALLGQMAGRALEGGDSASGALLLEAAAVGHAGEGGPRAREAESFARWGLAKVLASRGAWVRLEQLTTALRTDHRSGALSEEAWRAVLGTRDFAASVDPEAWLDATRIQAAAWRALGAEDLRRAEELLALAEDRVAHSRQARTQQEDLVRALSEAHGR